MDKTRLGAAAAISALIALPSGAASAATASQPAVPKAQSFSELLDPIPNAGERLKLADAEDAAAPRLIPVQYAVHHHHHAHVVLAPPHHHHHHRRWRRPPPRHHHRHDHN